MKMIAYRRDDDITSEFFKELHEVNIGRKWSTHRFDLRPQHETLVFHKGISMSKKKKCPSCEKFFLLPELRHFCGEKCWQCSFPHKMPESCQEFKIWDQKKKVYLTVKGYDHTHDKRPK